MKKSTVDNWDSIEKNWREKLDSHEEVVPGAIWEQMEKKLDEKNKKAYPFIIHRRQWSWAAVLLISFWINLVAVIQYRYTGSGRKSIQ